MNDKKAVPKKIVIADTEETKEELTDDIHMMVTSMIHKDGNSFARVSFLRGSDWAEGIVPGARIEKSKGFDAEEIRKLEMYLANEEKMILKQAKGVNPLRNLFELP